MKIKSILLLITLAISSHFAFATSLSRKIECPSVEAIQTAGVHDAIKMQGSWVPFAINNFSTPENWSIVFLVDSSADKDEVIKVANENMGLLKLTGSQPSEEGMFCQYYAFGSNQDIRALAVTPPKSFPPNQ